MDFGKKDEAAEGVLNSLFILGVRFQNLLTKPN